MTSLSEIAVFAERIVREAGAIAAAGFRRSEVVAHKSSGDLVTQADLAVEQQIVLAITGSFPEHGIVSEESDARGADNECVWILDPIDGTNYFARGIPLYSISLALRQREEIVLGVVFNPQTGELFSAVRGAGSRLNGETIHSSSKQSLSEATLCVEIPNRHFSQAVTRRAMGLLASLVDRVDRIRIIGVSALGLCYCACGGFDAYLNLSTGTKLWDRAAGQIILQEAGARFTWLPENLMVGGPAALHDELLQVTGLNPQN